MGGEPVYLNIYDLSDQNSWTYWCGVGIFHSGLEAYGVEYAYGGVLVLTSACHPAMLATYIEMRAYSAQAMSTTCPGYLPPTQGTLQVQVVLLVLDAKNARKNWHLRLANMHNA